MKLFLNNWNFESKTKNDNYSLIKKKNVNFKIDNYCI